MKIQAQTEHKIFLAVEQEEKYKRNTTVSVKTKDKKEKIYVVPEAQAFYEAFNDFDYKYADIAQFEQSNWDVPWWAMRSMTNGKYHKIMEDTLNIHDEVERSNLSDSNNDQGFNIKQWVDAVQHVYKKGQKSIQVFFRELEKLVLVYKKANGDPDKRKQKNRWNIVKYWSRA